MFSFSVALGMFTDQKAATYPLTFDLRSGTKNVARVGRIKHPDDGQHRTLGVNLYSGALEEEIQLSKKCASNKN